MTGNNLGRKFTVNSPSWREEVRAGIRSRNLGTELKQRPWRELFTGLLPLGLLSLRSYTTCLGPPA